MRMHMHMHMHMFLPRASDAYVHAHVRAHAHAFTESVPVIEIHRPQYAVEGGEIYGGSAEGYTESGYVWKPSNLEFKACWSELISIASKYERGCLGQLGSQKKAEEEKVSGGGGGDESEG